MNAKNEKPFDFEFDIKFDKKEFTQISQKFLTVPYFATQRFYFCFF